MCDIGDWSEPFEMFCESEVKARKAHMCDSCGGRIEPGTTYLRHFSKFEGDICSEKMCALCLVDRKEFTDEHGVFTCPSETPGAFQDCIESRDNFSSMLKWARALRRIKSRWESRL